MLSDTSWAKSLSGVTIYTLKLFFSASLATVPIISSASYPSFSRIDIFIEFSISLIYGMATNIGSGVLSLLLLYSVNISDLVIDPPLSKATAM